MSATRRILMTVDAVGGVWQQATELAAALSPLGYETVLALLGPAPGAAERRAIEAESAVTLVDTGLPLDWLADDASAVEAAGAAIVRLAAERRVDLVQLNQPALAAACRPRVPLVAMMHSCLGTWWQAMEPGAPPAEFASHMRQVGAGLAAADAIVCPSHAFAAAVTACYGLSETPRVVHNGRTPLPAMRGALHDFAFTTGRLWDRAKDAATLDRAAARLSVPFKAAGALVGPQGERVAFDHLHALGRVDESAIAGCLAARPVFVSAARYEPFGLGVLEAALAGCPLVLADIPTFRELWGDAALFVTPGDDAGFVAAIEALVGDMPIRLMRGEVARLHAARYTPQRMAAGMAETYRALLGESATGAARKVAA